MTNDCIAVAKKYLEEVVAEQNSSLSNKLITPIKLKLTSFQECPCSTGITIRYTYVGCVYHRFLTLHLMCLEEIAIFVCDVRNDSAATVELPIPALAERAVKNSAHRRQGRFCAIVRQPANVHIAQHDTVLSQDPYWTMDYLTTGPDFRRPDDAPYFEYNRSHRERDCVLLTRSTQPTRRFVRAFHQSKAFLSGRHPGVNFDERK